MAENIIDEIQLGFNSLAHRASTSMIEAARLRAENARLRRELEEARATLVLLLESLQATNEYAMVQRQRAKDAEAKVASLRGGNN